MVDKKKKHLPYAPLYLTLQPPTIPQRQFPLLSIDSDTMLASLCKSKKSSSNLKFSTYIEEEEAEYRSDHISAR